jgi:cadmium resistance transport/sequestration family protein
MSWVLQTVGTAIIAFVATNIDALFVLTIFFSQTDGEFTSRHIIFGQYLGFAAIAVLSVVASLGVLVVPVEWIGLLGLYPIFLGIRALLTSLRRAPTKVYSPIGWSGDSAPGRSGAFRWVLNTQSYGVAAVTFANGGDNISTYVPLFASVGFLRTGIILVVFFPLVALWCYAGYKLGGHQKITSTIERYDHVIVPFVLIALGIYILTKTGTLAFLLG